LRLLFELQNPVIHVALFCKLGFVFATSSDVLLPLPKYLSLIASMLKISPHHTFTHKVAIRFLSSLHQLLYFAFVDF